MGQIVSLCNYAKFTTKKFARRITRRPELQEFALCIRATDICFVSLGGSGGEDLYAKGI